MKDFLLNSLENILDKKDILIDKDDKYPFSKDWSSLKPTEPEAVVFPKCRDQVFEIVKLCNSSSQSFIPSGGRTGLSGGATSVKNELIISFDKFNKILDFDESDNSVLCEPGLITANLQNFASKNNLFYPVDFSSVGSSQIGGNIATNAGGIKVVKYGLTSKYVKGLEVSGGSGEYFNFDKRLVKDATGPDLKNLFIGSEGIFGIFLSCRMKLIKPPPPTKTALMGFSNLDDLTKVQNKTSLFEDIEAIEFFTNNCIKKVKSFLPDLKNLGFESKYYLIIEYSSKETENELHKFVLKNSFEEILIGETSRQKENIWKNRLLISESINNLRPLKFDISVPLNNFGLLVKEIEKFIEENKFFEAILFGHIGDGNLHANFLELDKSHAKRKSREKVEELIVKLVNILGGSISAEHGIGFIKRELYLNQDKNNDIASLQAIKKNYDPKNLLNPYKLI